MVPQPYASSVVDQTTDTVRLQLGAAKHLDLVPDNVP